MVTVYTKPNCIQCDMTKNWLDREDIPYTVIDLTENKQAYDMVVEFGFLAVPVVVTNDGMWAGFKPDKLRSLSNR
jgi:glutaredoxin-like protein NrdH